MQHLDSINTNPKISGKFELPTRPFIEPGVYDATITSWRVMPLMFGGPKLMIQCNLVCGDEIVELANFCNVKLDEQNQILPPSRRSHLYKFITALLPDDGLKRDLDHLIGLRCRARVETCDKDEKRQPKPEVLHYSVIRDLQPVKDHFDDSEEIVPF